MKGKNISGENSRKSRKGKPFSSILFIPMLILTLFQIIIFFLVLLFGGEFLSIKRYSYDILNEKTINKKSLIENLLNDKTTRVHETGREINKIVAEILAEKEKNIDDIQSDKQLVSEILNETSERIVYLLRINQVNDAFIILDTGSLYGSESAQEAGGFYVRDANISVDGINDNDDLLLEAGSSSAAMELDISLDFEWESRIGVGKNENGDFDFYHNTLSIARENPHLSHLYFGNWSDFSSISPSALPSMKYTIPLISDDDVVYGVIGVGLLEKSILTQMQSGDFEYEKSCYILASKFDKNSTEYSVVSHSGLFYDSLGNDAFGFSKDDSLYENIYKFDGNKDIIYSLQEMNIYAPTSLFSDHKWAVISAVKKNDVMVVHDRLLIMLFLSSVISMFVCIVIALILNKRLSMPVKKMISTLGKYDADEDKLMFESSNIKEFDKLAESIVGLQVNVRNNSSRVSKIINMADVGIGVFMYDMSDQDVFVGESLTKIFHFRNEHDSDILIPFDIFMKYLNKYDTEQKLLSSPVFDPAVTKSVSDNIEIVFHDEYTKSTRWLKFSLTRDNNNVVGLVQDITNLVIEKKKIEYERDYDVTTGLFNRRAFYDKVEELFSEPDKLGVAAFLMWDLDNLKYVNDTYGHDFGDDYIKTAANVFKLFRDHNGIIARLSGDEFIIFLYGFEDKNTIREIINDVEKKLNSSSCVLSDGTKYRVRASGGISWFPDDSKLYEVLIKYADFAMYEIKHSTKGRVAEFNINTYSKDSILVTGVEEMNRIIDEKKIRYAFQSIVSVQTGQVYGYEALMRPQSEMFKSPLEFIRIARTGAKLYDIERLTWILALRQFGELMKKNIITGKEKIFINSLLNCQIKDADVKEIESENSTYLSNVVLEFLESERSNEEYTTGKQELIKKWHAMTAVDDFGSGYNSEYALITYEPDIVKIDRAIVCGCESDVSRKNIIANLVLLAKEKNVLVLAEGVETYNEMKTVIECGVDLIQGFYVARPMFEPQKINEVLSQEIVNIYESVNNKK